MNGKTLMACSAIIGFAVLFSGIAVSVGISSSRSSAGTVSVRGLAEREVNADLAVWPLTFSVAGNDLKQVQAETIEKIAVVKDFLSKYDFSENEIIVKEPAITDTTANPYMSADERRSNYIAKTVILIRSANVNETKRALSESLDLVGRGVAVTQDYDSRVTFSYTALNEIKPDMIAEATKNARVAAEQFARDSGSKVGKIKSASQGLFSIESVDQSLPEKMTVRVVATIVYELK